MVERPPAGDQWWHETKFDGNRLALRIDGKRVELLSRRMQSWTARLPHLVEAAKRLPVRSALIDGELVAVQADGTTSLQALQIAFRENRVAELVYYAFDLLYLDGRDLSGCTLEMRKDALVRVVAGREGKSAIRYSQHTVGQGPKLFKTACRKGLEGIICKRRDSVYSQGRGLDWLKAKCVKREEFVIGGYTDPEGARKNFRALLLGYPRRYAVGRPGLRETGHYPRPSWSSRRQISRRLEPVAADYARSAAVEARPTRAASGRSRKKRTPTGRLVGAGRPDNRTIAAR